MGPGLKLPSLVSVKVIETTASSSNSCEIPCSSSPIGPSDTSIAASLTNEIVIEIEPIEGKQDYFISFDDSSLKVNNCNLDSDEDNKQEEEDPKEPVVWTKDSSSMKHCLIKKKQAYLMEIPKEPYEIFRLFLDDELLDLIVEMTNKHAEKCSWASVTRDELMIFLGLLIHTGTIRVSSLSDYWNNHYLFVMKSFARFMKRERFLALLSILSCAYPSLYYRTEELNKIIPIIDNFNKIMNKIYYPGPNLILATSISVRNNHVEFNEPILSKRRHSDKDKINMANSIVHMLVDSSNGLVLKLSTTHVERHCNNKSVLLNLLKEKLYNGHSVYMTETYSSFRTFSYLLDRNTHCTGPISDAHVKNMRLSKISCEKRAKKGNTFNENASYFCRGIHLCRIDDQFYLSNQHDDEMLHVPAPNGGLTMKPKLLTMYDSVMELDLDEDLVEFYPCLEVGLPWNTKVFIHVVQLALLNSYKLYKTLHEPLKSFYDFRLNILQKMLPLESMLFGYNQESFVITMDFR